MILEVRSSKEETLSLMTCHRALATLDWSMKLFFLGLGFRDIIPPIMENQTEKKMENEMETGGIYRASQGLATQASVPYADSTRLSKLSMYWYPN